MTPPASGLGTIVHVMVKMHIISPFSMSVNLFQFCKFILSFWEDRIPTARFKMNNQQGPTVQYMELYSMLHASLDERRIWRRMNMCICVAEFLHRSPETTTTLLISYTSIQN